MSLIGRIKFLFQKIDKATFNFCSLWNW